MVSSQLPLVSVSPDAKPPTDESPADSGDRFYFRQLLAGRDFATTDPVARQMVNFVYLIGDRVTRECLVVDPAYGVQELAEIAAADGIPGAHDARISEGRAHDTIDSDRVAAALPELARRNVSGLRIEPPSLEELFLRDYGDRPQPEDAPSGSGR